MEKLSCDVKTLLLKQLNAIQNYLELEADMRTTDKMGDAFEELISAIEASKCDMEG